MMRANVTPVNHVHVTDKSKWNEQAPELYQGLVQWQSPNGTTKWDTFQKHI